MPEYRTLRLFFQFEYDPTMRHGSYHQNNENSTINWQGLKVLWPYLLEFRVRVSLAMACLLLAKLASITLPFVLKHIVDHLDQADEVSATQVALAAPIALILFYGFVRFMNVILNELRDTLFGRVTERAIRRIGLKTFQHLHSLDLDFHLNRRTGGLSRDIERGTSGINFLMRFMVFNIVPTLLEVLMVVGVLFYNYGFLYALITLISVLAYVAFSIYATEWRSKFIREANDADSTSNSRTVDSLLNYETVKYFTNEDYEARRYDENLATWEGAKRKNRLSLFALNAGQALIIASAMTSMLALASVHTARGEMSIGDFVLINAFMMQLFIPLNFLGFVYREIKGSLINIEQMLGLLDKRAKVQDKNDAQPLAHPREDIGFQAIDFHYNPDRQILKNVSFDIPAGKKVAIVGESGSGKSTLVKLLFRFYDANKGSIHIGGQDIRDITQHSLRRAIGVVPQDTVLFNDSIMENIRYGQPEASDAEVYQAIELAHLSQFVSDLPKGVDTVVGERGLKLSGGEKQRVAIARTILKKPDILVFDEATSSLDSESEQSILQALNEIGKGYTSMVIAHRLSTIVDADNIVVLHKGEVAEQGNHQELLARRGVYAKLWEIQQQNRDTREAAEQTQA
jgi:ATP-binding cassette subfamily B protein